ncbi:hypothetical protein DLL80_23805 [Salmonella enterica subsp. enterica serovar Newport]|uniref:Uncharacterized protein n=1 Tax=Salmonella newport TaxID=108619 RepID=A0A5V6RML7_SALNE|nr:hypothetical protein [Salmonella enterica subsp. enterica serovar Newport]
MFISTGWLITIAILVIYGFYKTESAHLRQIGRMSIQVKELENRVECLDLVIHNYDESIRADVEDWITHSCDRLCVDQMLKYKNGNVLAFCYTHSRNILKSLNGR